MIEKIDALVRHFKEQNIPYDRGIMLIEAYAKTTKRLMRELMEIQESHGGSTEYYTLHTKSEQLMTNLVHQFELFIGNLSLEAMQYEPESTKVDWDDYFQNDIIAFYFHALQEMHAVLDDPLIQAHLQRTIDTKKEYEQ